MSPNKTNQNSRQTILDTWIAGVLVTTCHFLILILIADLTPIAWFELPVLAVVVILAILRRININLALCYVVVCLFLLAEPATGVSCAIWFALLPLLVLLEREKRFWPLAGLGLWMGVLIGSGIYSWVWRAMTVFFELGLATAFLPFLLFAFLIGLQLAIFLPLASILQNHLRVPFLLIFPGLYSLIEYWMPWPMSFSLGYAFLYFPLFLQTADLLGLHGISLLIAIASAAIYALIKGARAENRHYRIAGVGVIVTVLGLQIVYGLWCLSYYRDTASRHSVDIAMIQPVAPLKVRNSDQTLQRQAAAVLKRLSLEAINGERPDLLIWPEGAGPFASRTPEFNPAYMQAVSDVQKETSTTLLVQDIEFTRSFPSERLRYYSAVSLIEPVGRTTESYHKNILMPFSEYLPLEKTFPFLRKWLPEARSILPGEKAVPLRAPGGVIAPLICYEVSFPNYVRRLVQRSCSYIVNLTNDRWYGIRQQPLQHQGLAILRAVENRKPVARATNSGISAFIDARGVIAPASRTRVMEQTFLRGRLQPRPGTTFYARFGDILHPYILTPLYLVLLGYACLSRRSGSRPSSSRH